MYLPCNGRWLGISFLRSFWQQPSYCCSKAQWWGVRRNQLVAENRHRSTKVVISWTALTLSAISVWSFRARLLVGSDESSGSALVELYLADILELRFPCQRESSKNRHLLTFYWTCHACHSDSSQLHQLDERSMRRRSGDTVQHLTTL
jgi:hypothetical protein